MLLLDEPVSGLDPEAAAEMYAILRALHRSGVTILMITHDVKTALADATHVLHLGESVFWGTAEATPALDTFKLTLYDPILYVWLGFFKDEFVPSPKFQ